MLSACTCAISIESLCCNCSGGNILGLFLWIYLLVTEFIEEFDDLGLNCLDDVLYWRIPETSSIIGEVVGGSKVLRSLRCISVVLNGNIPPLKASETFFHEIVILQFSKMFFLSGVLPLYTFLISVANILCSTSASFLITLLVASTYWNYNCFHVVNNLDCAIQ